MVCTEEQEASSSISQGRKKYFWYLDSGRSRDMTGDKSLLIKFEEKVGLGVNFEDDNKGFTLGYGLIAKEIVNIEHVALVEGLKHNNGNSV